MKKILKYPFKKFEQFMRTDVSRIIVSTIFALTTVNIIILNAILGNWQAVFAFVVVLVIFVMYLVTQNIIKRLMHLNKKSQELINDVIGQNERLAKIASSAIKSAKKAHQRRKEMRKVNRELRKELGQEVEEEDEEDEEIIKT